MSAADDARAWLESGDSGDLPLAELETIVNFTKTLLDERDQVRAMLSVASDSLHDTAEGLGKWDDGTEWVEYAGDMVRYCWQIIAGRPDLVPERYRQKAARFLERERLS
ncbi:hypothetical protein SEA_LUTUM_58 [Gordonia phage Lutum]|uniref:Uncharacterized protein n=1 Tax=Gordonia phage Lutum TaxID=2572527 RepID=A0A4D6T6M1_9CAUD|nr:hypothetical protein SEA_LUTUM_58 [Gordonia phage Lutum]